MSRRVGQSCLLGACELIFVLAGATAFARGLADTALYQQSFQAIEQLKGRQLNILAVYRARNKDDIAAVADGFRQLGHSVQLVTLKELPTHIAGAHVVYTDSTAVIVGWHCSKAGVLSVTSKLSAVKKGDISLTASFLDGSAEFAVNTIKLGSEQMLLSASFLATAKIFPE